MTSIGTCTSPVPWGANALVSVNEHGVNEDDVNEDDATGDDAALCSLRPDGVR